MSLVQAYGPDLALGTGAPSPILKHYMPPSVYAQVKTLLTAT